MRTFSTATVIRGVMAKREDLIAAFGEAFEEEIKTENSDLMVVEIKHGAVIVGEEVQSAECDIDTDIPVPDISTMDGFYGPEDDSQAAALLTAKGVVNRAGCFLVADVTMRASR